MIPRMDSRSLPYLLHTRLYEAFCLEYAGQMLHHVPNVSHAHLSACEDECKLPDERCGGPDGKPMTREGFAHLYQQAFGEVPCPTIWFPQVSPEEPSIPAHISC